MSITTGGKFAVSVENRNFKLIFCGKISFYGRPDLDRDLVSLDLAMNFWYVYILQSLKNGNYYIGSTDNLIRRLTEHNRGKTKSTRYLTPFELKYKERYNTRIEARKRELYLKRLKSRKYLEKLVRGA